MKSNAGMTSRRNVLDWARNEEHDDPPALRALRRRARQAHAQGHACADRRRHGAWFLERGVDGFLIQPSYLPGGLEEFIAMVIPVRRNAAVPHRVRGDNLAATIRLPRPKSRYAVS